MKWLLLTSSQYMAKIYSIHDPMRYVSLILCLMVPFWGQQSGSRFFGRPSEMQGIDVSHHQKVIEWDTVVAKQDLRFAFVKATEGGDFTDSLFCNNWDALERLGVHRGAYHFFRAYGCGYEQAVHFLKTVEMKPGDLAPVLDLETTDGIPAISWLEEANIWIKTVENHLGIKPIIYTNLHFYEKYLAGVFDEYPLWIARYSEEMPFLSTGKQWDIWQYSNKEYVDGIEKKVDMNVFQGDSLLFDRLRWYPADQTAAKEAIFSAP
jgi:lysozyme